MTRVLIESSDGASTWTTIGVNENIIEASLQALVDSLEYGAAAEGVRRPSRWRVDVRQARCSARPGAGHARSGERRIA